MQGGRKRRKPAARAAAVVLYAVTKWEEDRNEEALRGGGEIYTVKSSSGLDCGGSERALVRRGVCRVLFIGGLYPDRRGCGPY
ncbi:NAD-dependent protein deacetylase h.t1.c1 [Apiospora arundinis]